MNEKHTPGPWYLQNRRSKIKKYEHNQKAFIMARARSAFRVATVSGPSNLESLEEWESNARLIAAAPELLAALEAIAPPSGTLAKKGSYENARAAIEKATQ